VLSEEIESLEKRLREELVQSKRFGGVGLAAPQIGVNKRIAIVTNGTESLCLVNPKILETKGILVHKGEGCLSIPGKTFNTYRFKEVRVVDDLHPGGIVATGLVAIIIQHEVDHTFGILITDRVAVSDKIGRNDSCPCGSKIKFKKCHGRDP
jgi:peptide deformylase